MDIVICLFLLYNFEIRLYRVAEWPNSFCKDFIDFLVVSRMGECHWQGFSKEGGSFFFITEASEEFSEAIMMCVYLNADAQISS